MNEKYNYELIKDYLDGLLDKQASMKVKQLIKSDETARDIAKGILKLKEKFEDDFEIENYLDDRLKLILNKTNRPNNLRWWKVAASIALITSLGVIGYYYSGPSLETLVEKELHEHYDYDMVLRSNDGFNSFDKAMQLYARKDYELAYLQLVKVEAPMAYFFRGVSLLQLKKYEEAIAELENEKLLKTRYSEQAEWYLILAYLKIGKEVEAKKKLGLRILDESSFKHEECVTILNLLEE